MFPIDDPQAEYPLSRRLASEQNWSHEYALRAVEEYRKFIFMCMISKKMCTPSYRVDLVWHLHLIYTRSYWEGMCVRTLGRLIHHEPGTGVAEDETRFTEMYVTTLELYERLFGLPPEDIWGRKEGERRRPANCAAVRTRLPEGPVPENEQALLDEIEKASARLKQQAIDELVENEEQTRITK